MEQYVKKEFKICNWIVEEILGGGTPSFLFLIERKHQAWPQVGWLKIKYQQAHLQSRRQPREKKTKNGRVTYLCVFHNSTNTLSSSACAHIYIYIHPCFFLLLRISTHAPQQLWLQPILPTLGARPNRYCFRWPPPS